jgi:hypothetical protein
MAKADKALVLRRIDDLLRVRLAGGEWWDLRNYVREKQAEPGSAWFLEDGENPLSDSQIRRYQRRVDDLIQQSHERSRRKLFRRHLAQRRHLYAKAVAAGDVRTALAILADEAELLGLYPPKKAEVTSKGTGIVSLNITEVLVGKDAVPTLDHLEEEIARNDRCIDYIADKNCPPPSGPAGVSAE